MNLPGEQLIRQFFNKYFWRQHPETALRYLPVVSEIKRANLTDSKILEIGSGSLGIIPFLKKPIVGADVDFSGPNTNLLKKIKANADDLPFKKNAFDTSVSVDVLEHLSQERREKAIFEMLRVTKKLAIIVVPEGEDSEKQDRQLQQLHNKVFSKTNQFLDQHVNFGLPRKEQILVAIDKSARKLGKKTKIQSHQILNLGVRNILMRTWITRSKLLYYLYLKGFLLLVPILRYCNFGKCYRRVFVIEFERQS